MLPTSLLAWIVAYASLRSFLVFVIQFNPQQDRASINQLAFLVGTGMLNLWVWISGGVYMNWYLMFWKAPSL